MFEFLFALEAIRYIKLDRPKAKPKPEAKKDCQIALTEHTKCNTI
ncbi:hypothetical protein AGMMS50230_21840 [Spirochaetia bacterium]|nr:hypothetical protein AGMMS50230_21840 [Spirochaetia bacterium]